MEVHFVHANAGGSLAVIGVLMTAGRANSAFSKIVSTMPEKEGPAVNAGTTLRLTRAIAHACLLSVNPWLQFLADFEASGP